MARKKKTTTTMKAAQSTIAKVEYDDYETYSAGVVRKKKIGANDAQRSAKSGGAGPADVNGANAPKSRPNVIVPDDEDAGARPSSVLASSPSSLVESQPPANSATLIIDGSNGPISMNKKLFRNPNLDFTSAISLLQVVNGETSKKANRLNLIPALDDQDVFPTVRIIFDGVGKKVAAAKKWTSDATRVCVEITDIRDEADNIIVHEVKRLQRRQQQQEEQENGDVATDNDGRNDGKGDTDDGKGDIDDGDVEAAADDAVQGTDGAVPEQEGDKNGDNNKDYDKGSNTVATPPTDDGDVVSGHADSEVDANNNGNGNCNDNCSDNCSDNDGIAPTQHHQHQQQQTTPAQIEHTVMTEPSNVQSMMQWTKANVDAKSTTCNEMFRVLRTSEGAGKKRQLLKPLHLLRPKSGCCIFALNAGLLKSGHRNGHQLQNCDKIIKVEKIILEDASDLVVAVTDDVFLRERVLEADGFVMSFEQLWAFLDSSKA